VGTRIAGRQQRRDLLVGGEREGEARRVSVSGDQPDVHDLECSGEGPARVEEVPALGGAEGHGEVGAHRAARDGAGVRVHPRGQVNGHDAGSALVQFAQRLDGSRGQPLGLTPRAGAQHGVQREVPGIARGEQARQVGLALERHRVESRRVHALQVDASVAAYPRKRSHHAHRDRRAVRTQPACGHEAIAAIVARAREHQHAQAQGRAVAPLHRGDHARARAFHQFGAGDEAALDGGPVQPAHLVRGQQVHVSGP
jgi:hypothetical protein